ncbi:TPA: helix-turn-helix domain-containing protein [Acinetobacter baumannii]|uniref:YdaS family helix-turn-helix protein n=1 Tax=Acinetobacter calcoaceticus/baumannii complex TaxID=909768 RepID=UPI00021B7877|nr:MULTISPECIES: YdaS family helix-turn-helix protein [Acinetobacter calcoaceticus/baumannii complex]EXD21301.1 hypothetical protein J480_4055 [Acinetobacter baumannii 34654]KCW28412.1 hypothetical protein J474_3896 [Acinetobacter baumannii 6935]EGU03076.1 hypothetical protein ABNIH4_05719 [Acinetobacter baumannii ABNIH4]EIB7230202.1 helix-turn-helix domain-containing protein [Acinetobacter baumannii]EIB7254220.1 helix-turn-helix domain-containing protein [Acinetobacter baumannii]
MQKPSLKQYFSSLSEEQQKAFAAACETTTGQIKQIMYGYRPCNPSLAINIDRESKGQVRCDDLCPDTDFDYLRRTPKQKRTA